MTRVIGARELERLAIGALLTVPEDAIITPLARDVIQEKRLRLQKVEAQAQAASRRRAEELEAAEAALNESLRPSSRATAPDKAATVGEGRKETPWDEAQVASVVEATVKRLLGESLLKRINIPGALKLAVFGPSSAVVLSALTEESQRCGMRIERLSGRSVSGVFVLAAAATCPSGGQDEARRMLEQNLSRRCMPVVFEAEEPLGI
ncbi:MAG: hypothetical protein JW759_07200 [Candidatus Coatesbacteria bacterium]|nr:hypothetical protein [Candidatus Coatesbacteria bacterium]